MELLEVLVENLGQRNGDHVDRSRSARRANPTRPRAKRPDEPALRTGGHPKVAEALAYIERNLRDPGLTVNSVAKALDVNAAYLAHLFSRQTGLRMSRYITSQRLAIAKELLRTTPWQIKNIALECGFRNTDWFSEVFRVHTGCTPGDYRRAAEPAG